jgi:hypothetical protein
MDNSDIVRIPDHDRVNMKENYDVEYWTRKLNINRERLKEAVEAVGTSAEEVQKYFK